MKLAFELDAPEFRRAVVEDDIDQVGDAAYPKLNPDNLRAVGSLVAGQGNMDLGGDCEVCVIDPESTKP